MITPALKDKILEFFVSNCPHLKYSGEYKELAKQFDTNEEVIQAILKQFHNKGLIKFQPFIGGCCFIDITADAHDYILRGGHLGEYEQLEMQVQKLKNDISSFESSIPKDKYDNLQKTLSLILTAASTYKAFS